MLESFKLDKTFQYLLVSLAFLMPLTVFGANLIIVLIVILWALTGNYKSKIDQIIKSKVLIASILFFILHIVGLLWTEDLRWGLHIIHKMWYFLLLFPILYTLVKKEHIRYYISAFLLAIFFTEVLSYLVWFEIIPPFKNASVYNPTPFMSHISYNPILAFSIYLILHELLFNKSVSKFKLVFYSFLSVSMSINMFITGGRAGQVMFFTMLCIIIFQYFNYKKLISLVVSIVVVISFFYIAFNTSEIFHNRVTETLTNIENFETNKNTSVGERIVFAMNSWEIIINNPIIGSGTGDFPIEYKKINMQNTPELTNATNPHNMYVLILVQLGIIGLISFLSIIFYQIKFSILSKDRFIRETGLALPLLFLIIMLSDSYLLGHYTTLMYIFFSSFLYKDFEKT